MNAPAARRRYLDVLRGMTVLIMIEAHVIDSWTRVADRRSRAFGESLILGGFAAPLFLFLAGVAIAMSAGSKARRSGDSRAAAAAVRKRGLQIFALAFLFRFQSFILSHAPAWTLLKVDILNVMGPSMVAAVGVWALFRAPKARIAGFIAATLAIVLVTPLIRHAGALASLPDSIEGYLRPIPGLTNFTFFPWAAFLTAGAAIGVVLDMARSDVQDRRTNIALLAGGFALAFIAYEASFLPPLDVRSSFWTTSVSFFFMRLGLMIAAIGVAWVWEQRPGAGLRWSPLQVLGRSSLFIYWIHVEMVYGIVSNPLHRAFSVGGAWVALGVFWVLMLGAAVVKDSAKRKYLAKRDLREKLNRRAQPLMF
ncbi:MAG TPA: acyltransferase [Vicinamibacterales bacterium]|nr:acyltransferase [Vicinamibacterales bacterium]